jgi:hypothetical protein
VPSTINCDLSWPIRLLAPPLSKIAATDGEGTNTGPWYKSFLQLVTGARILGTLSRAFQWSEVRGSWSGVCGRVMDNLTCTVRRPVNGGPSLAPPLVVT